MVWPCVSKNFKLPLPISVGYQPPPLLLVNVYSAYLSHPGMENDVIAFVWATSLDAESRWSPPRSSLSCQPFIDRDRRNNFLRSTNQSGLLPAVLMCSMHIMTSWLTGTFPQNCVQHAGGPIYLPVCCLNSCKTGRCIPYVTTKTISSSLTFASMAEPNVFMQLLL